MVRTKNEDHDFIVFHNDLAEHDTNASLDGKNQAESNGIESTPTETTPYFAVEPSAASCQLV